jgi:hypothetical protein
VGSRPYTRPGRKEELGKCAGRNDCVFNDMQKTAQRQLVPLFAILLGLAGSLGLVGCSGVASSTTPPPPPPPPTAAISVTPSNVAFGNVPTGLTNTQTMSVSNSGYADLNITQASVTGAGFAMSGLTAPVTIAAGRSSTFTVAFNPTTATGFNGSLSLTSNASNSPTMGIPLSGTGVTQVLQLSVGPNAVAFGNVPAGNSGTQPLTLTNSGNANVTVSQITVSGTALSETGITLPVTLSPNQTASFNAVFAPTGAVNLNGTITVVSTASNSPTVVSATGTGYVPVAHTVAMTWTASTSTVVGYYVYQGTLTGGPYTKLNATPVTATAFTDGTVLSGQDYFYVVTSVDSNGLESLFSNEAKAIIPIP